MERWGKKSYSQQGNGSQADEREKEAGGRETGDSVKMKTANWPGVNRES